MKGNWSLEDPELSGAIPLLFLIRNCKEIKKNLLEIKMNKGDALIWKDNEVLHGRNSFIAKENSARFIWKCAVNF